MFCLGTASGGVSSQCPDRTTGTTRVETSLPMRVRDNTSTPIPDQVQFRCDFPAWKHSLPFTKRQLVDSLALGHRTKDLATEFRLSEARISQLRKEFFEDYAAFCEGSAGG